MALSDTKLRALLNKPRAKLETITDRDSLSVRVTPKGKIIFQYRYRFDGKQKRYDIGSYPGTSLTEARQVIPELKSIVESGRDVKTEKDGEKSKRLPSNKATLDDCVNLFLEKYATKLRPKTKDVYRYTLNKHAISAFNEPVEEITKAHWYDYFDKVEERTTANMANSLIKMLKTCLRFCVERGLIEHHQLNEIATRSVGSTSKIGDRTPTIKEIQMINAEFSRCKCLPTTINTVKFIMLTGARCGEVRTMEKKDLDLETGVWTVPKEKSKTKTKIIRPLGPRALEIIKWQLETFGGFCDFVFPSGSYQNPITPQTVNKMCRAIVAKMDIEKWSVHDFRRSLSTILTEHGVQLYVTEKMLGHKLAGILSVYNKSEYIAEQREAYGIWEGLIGI